MLLSSLLRSIEMLDIECMSPVVVTADPDQLGDAAGAVAVAVDLENVVNGIGGLRTDKRMIEVGMCR